MNKVCFLLVWGILLPALAQDPSEIPAGNPTQFPTGNAAWTVDITPDSVGSSRKENFVTRLQVMRFGDVTRYVITSNNGKVVEQWRFASLGSTVGFDPDKGTALVVPDTFVKGAAFIPRFEKYEIAGFSWVDRPFYQDTTLYAKALCYRYEKTMANTQPDRNSNPSSPNHAVTISQPVSHQAWIDKKTHFPAALDDGLNLAVYTFLPPPTAPLVPAKAIVDEMNRWKALETIQKPSPPVQ